MSTNQPNFDTLIKHLEQVATQQPDHYKLRVLLLAILGYGYIFVVILFLLITNGVLLYLFLFFHNPLMAKLGIAIIVLIYFIIKALRVHFSKPEGIPIQSSQAPQLFQLLTQIRLQLQGPKIHTVLLTNDFNAAIVQYPRLGLLGWHQNYLLLGLPLMQALSVPQFTAVLAHEYGHLSGAHGRFSAWIYRIRKTWAQLMDALQQQQSRIGNALFKKFFDWYIPFFNAYTFVLARLNEYEADRSAAQIVGATYAAEALINVSLKSQFLAENFWPNLYAEANQFATPPYSPYTALPQAFVSKPAIDNSHQWLQQALQTQTDTQDTHPSLSDRLAALGEEARLLPPVETHAAQQFLGDHLAAFTHQMNQDWYAKIESQWQQRYQYVQSAKIHLQELTERANTTPLTVEEAWQQASLTEELISSAVALPLYQDLLKHSPYHPSASFAVGRILLKQNDEAGIQLITRAMQGDGKATLAGCELIYNFLIRQNRPQEAFSYLEKATQRIQLEQLAQAERDSLSQNDTFLPPGLTIAQRQPIVEQLKAQKGIKRAYLVRKQVQYLPEHPLYVVGIERSFGFRLTNDDRKYCQQLANTLSVPGSFFVVVLNSDLRKLHKKMKTLEETLIYEHNSRQRN